MNSKSVGKRAIVELKQEGSPVDSLARLVNSKNDLGGFFQRGPVKTGCCDRENAQQFAPVARQWVQALRRLNAAVSSAQSDVDTGLYVYEGGFATLSTISADCPDAGTGWDEIVFNQSISSEQIRTSNWNASGGWGGTFFDASLGGGGENYSKLINTATDHVFRLDFAS